MWFCHYVDKYIIGFPQCYEKCINGDIGYREIIGLERKIGMFTLGDLVVPELHWAASSHVFNVIVTVELISGSKLSPHK